jgi:hypothetical protein
MGGVAYTVVATFPDAQTAGEYVAWLAGGHLRQVVASGAESAMIVRVEEPADAIQVESRYVFPSREAYARYVAGPAVSLRAEGMRLFGPDRGVRMERRFGEIVGAAHGSAR